MLFCTRYVEHNDKQLSTDIDMMEELDYMHTNIKFNRNCLNFVNCCNNYSKLPKAADVVADFDQ